MPPGQVLPEGVAVLAVLELAHFVHVLISLAAAAILIFALFIVTPTPALLLLLLELSELQVRRRPVRLAHFLFLTSTCAATSSS